MFWFYAVMLLFARRRSERHPILIRFCSAGRIANYTLDGGNYEDRS